MMKSWLTLLLVLALVGCGKPELRALHSGSTVLAFGDSLTAGNGVKIDEAYPAELTQMLGITVINAGVSGETTEEGLNRLPTELERHSPDLVILFEGGNDILRNHDLSKTKQNLSTMISMIKRSGADVVLVAVPRKVLFSGAAKFYLELAEEHDVALQKGIVSSLLKKADMKSDSIHFNRAGYRAVAASIRDLLEAHGAV